MTFPSSELPRISRGRPISIYPSDFMPAPETQPASLQSWALTCDALAGTTKKLEKRAILAGYLATLAVSDAARAALYTAGQPFPEIDRRQLSVGSSLLGKAVSARTDASPQALALAFRRHGDIGSAAEDLLNAEAGEPKPPSLLLADLELLLSETAAARGPAAKLRLLSTYLARATAAECKYTLKLLSGDMRIGVKAALVEEAIAVAYAQSLSAVRHAGMLLGSLSEVVEQAAAGTLEKASMRLFHPIGFMLASPVDSVDEAVARFAEEIHSEHENVSATPSVADTQAASSSEPAISPKQTTGRPTSEEPNDLPGAPPEAALREAQLEDKYDGMRAQLHAGDPANPGHARLFSRNREDLSAAFPELIEAFAALPEAVILDGEILAWKPASATVESPSRDFDASVREESPTLEKASARALPFSSLQQRLGRRNVSATLRRTLPVVFMAFDILYADDKLLLDQPLSARRNRLEQYLAAHAPLTDGSTHQVTGQQQLFATNTDTESTFPRLLLAPTIRLTSAAQLDQAYLEARARGNEGVMLKASGSLYQPGRRGLAWLKLKRELATLDVLVTGAEFGSGRRAGYLSDYTFAIRDEHGDLLNIGKAYSGITDAEMHTLSAHFHEHTREDHGHFRSVEPDTVFEVAFNNITRSSRHASGYALRFPRILRIRTDKPPREIDTLARVTALYNQQPDRPVEE